MKVARLICRARKLPFSADVIPFTVRAPHRKGKSMAAQQYWLMKSEPDSFSWDDLVRQGTAEWDGVRSAQAANNMKAMKKDDLALFYNSKIGLEDRKSTRLNSSH